MSPRERWVSLQSKSLYWLCLRWGWFGSYVLSFLSDPTPFSSAEHQCSQQDGTWNSTREIYKYCPPSQFLLNKINLNQSQWLFTVDFCHHFTLDWGANYGLLTTDLWGPNISSSSFCWDRIKYKLSAWSKRCWSIFTSSTLLFSSVICKKEVKVSGLESSITGHFQPYTEDKILILNHEWA